MAWFQESAGFSMGGRQRASNAGGYSKRRKSPTSATMVIAVRKSTPRRLINAFTTALALLAGSSHRSGQVDRGVPYLVLPRHTSTLHIVPSGQVELDAEKRPLRFAEVRPCDPARNSSRAPIAAVAIAKLLQFAVKVPNTFLSRLNPFCPLIAPLFLSLSFCSLLLPFDCCWCVKPVR